MEVRGKATYIRISWKIFVHYKFSYYYSKLHRKSGVFFNFRTDCSVCSLIYCLLLVVKYVDMRGLVNLSNSSSFDIWWMVWTRAFDIIGNLSSAVLSSTIHSDLLFGFSVISFFLTTLCTDDYFCCPKPMYQILNSLFPSTCLQGDQTIVTRV